MLRPSRACLWKAIQAPQVRHRGYDAVQHLCHGVFRFVEQVHLAKVNTALDALLSAVRRRVAFTHTDKPLQPLTSLCESACVIAGC